MIFLPPNWSSPALAATGPIGLAADDDNGGCERPNASIEITLSADATVGRLLLLWWYWPFIDRSATAPPSIPADCEKESPPELDGTVELNNPFRSAIWTPLEDDDDDGDEKLACCGCCWCGCL